MQKITPFLWYDGKAQEAAKFYTSIFKKSRIGSIRRYGEGGPGPKGSVMSVEFPLEGQGFIALNGGPHFSFSPAISFFVDCKAQEEVDELWDKLSAGGEKQKCGWLKDRSIARRSSRRAARYTSRKRRCRAWERTRCSPIRKAA